MSENLMQQIAGALGYSTSSCNGSTARQVGGGATQHSGAAVLVSPPSMELTDRMYTDLIDSLRYSRDIAEKRACEAESRAQMLEVKIEELYSRVLSTTAAPREH